MSTTIRLNRKYRRRIKAKLTSGKSSVTHKSKSGRTGSAHSKKLKTRR